MKPLYWTRIVVPITQPQPPLQPQPSLASATATPTTSIDQIDSNNVTPLVSPTHKVSEIWQEIDEAQLDNLDEFTELFSRQAVAPKIKTETKKTVKIVKAKVLDSKRSQNVGIFSRSLHVDFAEIEHAIYHCDTSVVSLEALQQIMEIKATSEELQQIREIAKTDQTLDGPEQFLLKVSEVSLSAERISCIVFQADFDDNFTIVTRKLDSIRNLCDFIIENDNLKQLFSIILTLGNYMNGGNNTRGQADGFGLEILSKLKDVKSREPKITLLHYIIKTYIEKCRKTDGIPLTEVVMPIPDPLDVEKSVTVDFDDCKGQLTNLKKKVEGKTHDLINI